MQSLSLVFAIVLGLLSGVSASGPNAALGEKLGNLLSQAISSDPAGASAAWKRSTAGTSVVINPAVASVARAHSSFLKSCTELTACPKDWTTNGSFCEAPAGFAGCSKRMHRYALTNAMKVKFAEQCDVEFECADKTSFLQKLSGQPILNVHVAPQESGSGDSSSAQAAALESLEASNVNFKQQVASILSSLGGRSSFLQGGPLSDLQRIAENVGSLGQEIPTLKGELSNPDMLRVRSALLRLLELTSEPNAKNAMRMGVVGMAAAKLLKKESTPHSIRVLAGSLATLLSNAPVASEIMSTDGGDGNVNIVMPNPGRIYS